MKVTSRFTVSSVAAPATIDCSVERIQSRFPRREWSASSPGLLVLPCRSTGAPAGFQPNSGTLGWLAWLAFMGREFSSCLDVQGIQMPRLAFSPRPHDGY